MPNKLSLSRVSPSPLLLSHQLLALAESADRAGLRRSASRLVALAHSVCTERAAGASRPMSTSRRRAAAALQASV